MKIRKMSGLFQKRMGAMGLTALLFVTGAVLNPVTAVHVLAANTYTYDITNGQVDINDINSEDIYIFTGTHPNNSILLNIPDGVTAHIQLNNLSIRKNWGAAFSTQGNGNVEIELIGDSVITAGQHSAGIELSENVNLTINGTGRLTVYGGSNGAGIGSTFGADCGDIYILGGTVTAYGGDFGAGIGSGQSASCGNVYISGGNVIAYGGSNAAGIGSGGTSEEYRSSNQIADCGVITITGGEINAVGGMYGAGIGSGIYGNVDDICISAGIIDSTAGHSAAGIGSGIYACCSDIKIEGGNINSKGGALGAGIGSGENIFLFLRNEQSCGDIIITDGIVISEGGPGAAGIGSGLMSDCNDIMISGGDITAYCRNETGYKYYANGTAGSMLFGAGPGIGSGVCGTNNKIVISGGNIYANGASRGAGIGNGDNGYITDGIYISGGNIYATGGLSGAGIGSGTRSNTPEIQFSEDPEIHVSGGDSDGLYGSGAAIGSGGSEVADGEESIDYTEIPDTVSLFIYENSTSIGHMTGENLIFSNVSQDVPFIIPINYMKQVENTIETAIALGGEQTVTINGYSGLSQDIMKLLKENPQITLISEFIYMGHDFRITIPGSEVDLEDGLLWYGPKYLYPKYYIYGTDTLPSVQEYLDLFS